jgi:hypothetical protein
VFKLAYDSRCHAMSFHDEVERGEIGDDRGLGHMGVLFWYRADRPRAPLGLVPRQHQRHVHLILFNVG